MCNKLKLYKPLHKKSKVYEYATMKGSLHLTIGDVYQAMFNLMGLIGFKVIDIDYEKGKIRLSNNEFFPCWISIKYFSLSK